MIESRRQYQVTRREVDRFLAALDRAEERLGSGRGSDRLLRAERDAILGLILVCSSRRSTAGRSPGGRPGRTGFESFPTTAFALGLLLAPAVFVSLVDVPILAAGGFRLSWFALANGAICASIGEAIAGLLRHPGPAHP